jgi:hypothetical protein
MLRRTRHMTQFGDISGRGGGATGPVYQSFVLAGGPAATTDLMDGVDTTWSRIPGGAEIGKIAGQAIKAFDQKNPAASIPLLLSLRSKTAALPADAIVDEKRQLLDKIILDCLGLTVESAAPQAEVVPGEAFTLHNTVTVRSSVVPVEWKGFRATGMAQPLQFSESLRLNQPASRDAQIKLPSDTPLSQPYWLQEEAATGLYRVENPRLIGLAENPPVLPVRFDLIIGGHAFTITTESRQAETAAQMGANAGSTSGGAGRRLEVIAPVALTFPPRSAAFFTRCHAAGGSTGQGSPSRRSRFVAAGSACRLAGLTLGSTLPACQSRRQGNPFVQCHGSRQAGGSLRHCAGGSQ